MMSDDRAARLNDTGLSNFLHDGRPLPEITHRAIAKNQDMIGYRHKAHLMGHKDHCLASLLQGLDGGDEAFLPGRIKV